MKFHRDRQRQKKIEFWRSHLEAWRGSGLTQELYCRQYELQFSTFARYRNQINSEARFKNVSPTIAIPTDLGGTHQPAHEVHARKNANEK